MLTLTRRTEYALIAVCHLARVGRIVVSAREIAQQHAVPLPLLMNVLKRLNRTGYVTSVRGAHGGYVLAVPPDSISLTTLIEAVEGPMYLVRCAGGGESRRPCNRTGMCTIRHSVFKVHEQLRTFLSSVTIADIAFDEERMAVETAKVLAE